MAKGKRSADSKAVVRQNKKLLRDNVRSITKGAIRRLSRRAGIRRISASVYDEVRRVLKSYVESVVRCSCAFAEHSKKKTISSADVVNALRKRGQILYGY